MQLIFPVLPDQLASGRLEQSFFPDADDIRGMQFSGQTVQGLALRGFDVEGCRFSGCRFVGCRLEGFCLNPATFAMRSCRTAPFTGLPFETAKFPARLFPAPCSGIRRLSIQFRLTLIF